MKTEYAILMVKAEDAAEQLHGHTDLGWGVHTANLDDASCFVFLLSRLVGLPPSEKAPVKPVDKW